MLVNLADFEAAARRKMLPAAYDYFAGGSLDEWSLRDNELEFSRVQLCPRVLRGVQSPDARISLCGEQIKMPIIVSPTALQGLAHPDGEAATAAAAGAIGTVMTMSTTASCPVDQVTSASDGPVWFQLYLLKDRAISEELIRMAESAGCRAIVLTVDVPAWGRRERDIRNGFALPRGAVIGSLMLPGREAFYDGTMPVPLSQFINERFKFDLSWADVEWLSSFTKLPLEASPTRERCHSSRRRRQGRRIRCGRGLCIEPWRPATRRLPPHMRGSARYCRGARRQNTSHCGWGNPPRDRCPEGHSPGRNSGWHRSAGDLGIGGRRTRWRGEGPANAS